MSRHSKSKSAAIPYKIQIDSLSHEGRGVATLDGKKKFLRAGLPGEIVMATDTQLHRSYDEGEVIEVLQASPDRVMPPCPHTGVCGGCSLQHLHSTAQIAFKQAALLEQLKHTGNLEPEHILEPLLSPTEGYRHKARLGVKYVVKKQKVLVGFREINGRYLADLQSCIVLHPLIGKKISLLSAWIHTLEAYQTIPQIEVAIGEDVAALVFRHLQPLSNDDIERFKQFGAEQKLDMYLQPGGPDSVHCIYTTGIPLHYRLPRYDIVMPFKPTDFTQVNPYLNQKMIQRAIEILNPQPHEKLLDLFCGLGNFTLPLAKHCKNIVGVEGHAALVARAAENAALNQIQNAAFYTADLSADFSAAPFMHEHFDKIILDPPRTGALEAIKQLAVFKPSHILYVSCNPATLARDAKELGEQGYRLTHAGVMDMFPHTSHVESMALFKRS